MAILTDEAVLAIIEEKMGACKNLLASTIETVEHNCIRYTAPTDAISIIDSFLLSANIIAEKDAHTLKIRF